MTSLICDEILLADGWARDVVLKIDDAGWLAAVRPAAVGDAGERVAGPVIPGMPNLHSHAFQRAMAGLGERAGPTGDSFWTWRQVMYDFVGRLGPDAVEAIAAQLYVEMLKAGFTAVGEFHYLHHDPSGRPYADPAELSHRVIAAARRTGIGITHLPVLYAHGGFGGQPAADGQRRFLNDADGFFRIVDSAFAEADGDSQIAVGIAPHSLRAVTPDLLAEALRMLDARDTAAPVHIHIAEQTKEVDDCVAWSGARPVDWLFDNVDVDDRWCLVHATHMTEGETMRLATSGAVAGLCPTTEANLGDGLFPAPAYLRAGGRYGVGSDSHISVSP
ncbi:MAG: formimidoylglutamate deiminase, partial [Minwuiales bacterium]|nr:formimidoylglutamate deiminase [Minwuiales bacterium]